MMAVVERQVDLPRAVRLALHRVRRGMPVVEIAGDENFLRVRGAADEVHRLGHVLGGVTMFGNVKGRVRTVHYNVWCAKTAFIQFFAGWRATKEAQRQSARNFKFNLCRRQFKMRKVVGAK